MDYWLEEIRKERAEQDEKWGEQNHHPLLWFSIIGEEYGEMCHAFNEFTFDQDKDHLDDMQREAVHIAACCVAMLECLDRMGKEGFVPDGSRNTAMNG
jgi:hypothetical protein